MLVTLGRVGKSLAGELVAWSKETEYRERKNGGEEGEKEGERERKKKEACLLLDFFLYSPKAFPESLNRATLVALLTVNGRLGR